MEKPEEKFLIEEYKALWDYYKRTLDERHKLLEYYFKTVAIPGGLLTALTSVTIDTKLTKDFISPQLAAHLPDVLPVFSSGLKVSFPAIFWSLEREDLP